MNNLTREELEEDLKNMVEELAEADELIEAMRPFVQEKNDETGGAWNSFLDEIDEFLSKAFDGG